MNSTRDAARRIGITESAVIHAIRRGDIPAKRFGRSYIIADADIVRYSRYTARPRIRRCAPTPAPGNAKPAESTAGLDAMQIPTNQTDATERR